MYGPNVPLIPTIAIICTLLAISIKPAFFVRNVIQSTFVKYHKEHQVMTPTEKRFFYTLVQAIKGEYMILSKVRVADIIGVTAHDKKKGDDFWYAFDPLTRMHADFVLCNKRTTEPILVIELDDRTHTTKDKTKKNDKTKNKAYKKAGMPILRILPQQSYNQQEIAKKIHSVLNNDER